MKLSITPGQVRAAPISATQREQLVVELLRSGLKPSDLGTEQLRSAGMDPAVVPGVLFQLRATALSPDELGKLKGISDTLALLIEQGKWQEPTRASDLGRDNRVAHLASALAEIVSGAEAKGTIGRQDKAELDEIVLALLRIWEPGPSSSARLPDLGHFRQPQIAEHSVWAMGQRIVLQDGDRQLSLYSSAGGIYVEGGRSERGRHGASMVSLASLDHSQVKALVEIIDRAMASDSAPSIPLSVGKNAHSARGFLLQTRARVLDQAQHLFEQQKSTPSVQPGPDGTWFAAERLEVPAGASNLYRPGFVSDSSGYNHKMIIPEGAELWATGGRHPGELMVGRAEPGLWVRYQGVCYTVDQEGYASSRDPRLFGQYSQGRSHPDEPVGFPKHWHQEQGVAPRSSLEPRSAHHEIMNSGLRRLHGGAVQLRIGGGAAVLTASARNQDSQPSAQGTIEVRKSADGSLSLSGWRLECLSIREYDRETLDELRSLARNLQAATQDRAAKVLLEELDRAAAQATTALERDPLTAKMTAFLKAGLDFAIPQLKAFVDLGVTADDLAKVLPAIKASVDWHDPDVVAKRAAELIWPHRLMVSREMVQGAISAALSDDDKYLSVAALLAQLVLSGPKTPGLEEAVLNLESVKDGGSLEYRRDLACALLRPGAAKALFFWGSQSASTSDYRSTLMRAWGSLAAGARTPEERKTAYALAEKHFDTNYLDMGSAVLPAAALVVSKANRARLSARADRNVESQYWALASGALLAKALLAESDHERDAVYTRAKDVLSDGNLRLCICALNALGLTAHTAEQKAETLRLAHEYSFKNWRAPLRGAALMAMAMMHTDNLNLKRLASMASLDV